MENSTKSGRLTALVVGAALLGAGYLMGVASRPSAAWAAGMAPAGAGEAGFGFAVPANGFAVVSDTAGNAWVIGPTGAAQRVLYSVSGAAPDRPGRTEEQLPLR